MNIDDDVRSSRGNILTLVDVPIRFFALVLLVIESLMVGLVLATSGTLRMGRYSFPSRSKA